MYCDIIISMAPKMEAHGVINLKALPFCSVNIIIIISLQFPGGACLWAAEWEALFDFFMHVMLRYEFTVLGYNDLLLHLCVSSTLVNHGDKVFHYPPTASNSIAVFSSRTKGWAQDAVGSLLRGLSICMDALIRRWEWVFSLEKKLGQRKACM